MTQTNHLKNPNPVVTDSAKGTMEWPTERAFLHALSTPLSTLGLELDLLIDLMKNPQAINDAHASVEQMRKVLDRIYQLIQARRAQLPSQMTSSQPTQSP